MSDITKVFARVQDAVRGTIPKTRNTFGAFLKKAEFKELHIVDSFVSEIAIKTTA